MGLEKPDDAGVYKLTDEIALIQTVDFFTPIVDDPFLFGQIATANSLSDVYAMGGWPLCAMNIVCFPLDTMDIDVLREVLRGGLEKLREADTVLAGGHSIKDPELKFGLSVTGIVHPDRVLTNQGARPGDRLILTKPLGTGIISTALKNDAAGEKAQSESVTSMTTLNRKAAETMARFPVHACTDVTGFGLIGHACEMVEGSDLGFVLQAREIPLMSDVLEYAAAGFLPGGLFRNRKYRESMAHFGPDVSEEMAQALFDPQTSGGLLIAVDFSEAEGLLHALRDAGVSSSAIVGRVEGGTGGTIRVE